MRAQAQRFGTEILQGNVSKIEVNRCPIKIEVGDQLVYAEALIIATGASARLLGLPAERALLGQGLARVGGLLDVTEDIDCQAILHGCSLTNSRS